MADGVEHPLDLAVTAFVDRQLDRVRAEPARLSGGGAAVVELDACFEPLECLVGRLALDLGDVGLLDAVARVREPVRELPVVREQQRACRVDVETPDRDDARLVRDELDDRRPSSRLPPACGAAGA